MIRSARCLVDTNGARVEKTLATTGVIEPAKELPIYGEYEVVVLGGGPAGLAAAASAAHNGMSVLLIERYGFLGGMGTAAGVTNFCGLHANVHGEIRQVVHGIADDLLARMSELGGLNAPHLIFGKLCAQAYDMSAFKCAADSMLQAAGVQILFHALAAGVTRSDTGSVDALIVETKSGRLAVLGKVFIDCSGDADLAYWAGAAFEKGMVPGEMLYPSLMFRVGGVDPAAAGQAWLDIPKVMADAQQSGKYSFPRRGAIVRPQKNPTEWRVNVTQLADADGRATDGTNARALSAGELEGRRQITNYIKFLRQEISGFKDAYVLDIAPQLGIRETRRIVGEYMLSGQDVLDCASFADSIGVNGWPLEKHVAGDVIWEWPPIPESRGYNQLPFRMLLPRHTDGTRFRNLMVAGRCASMTHDGQSAARVTGACFAMGEAAGAAAALAIRRNKPVYETDTEALQAVLVAQGAFLGD